MNTNHILMLIGIAIHIVAFYYCRANLKCLQVVAAAPLAGLMLASADEETRRTWKETVSNMAEHQVVYAIKTWVASTVAFVLYCVAYGWHALWLTVAIGLILSIPFRTWSDARRVWKLVR